MHSCEQPCFDNVIASEAGAPIVPRNRTYGAGWNIAAHRPPCGSCGEPTHLFRIAPKNDGMAFKVEYAFECECGEETVIDEAALLRSRRNPLPARVKLPQEL